MELYKLNQQLQRVEVVEDYVSLLWTERYTPNGDMRMVIPDTPANRTKLPEGTYLSVHGSDEVMLVESFLAENGVITLVGRTLEVFFNERYFRNSTDTSVTEWAISAKPGAILSSLVESMAIDANDPAMTALGGTANAIPGIFLGDIDLTDNPTSRKVPFGPLYDAMLPIAETAKLGMKLKLSFADEFGFGLAFTVYRGLDRTSEQLERAMVRFSPSQDTMSNIKEARSIADFKNVAYVIPPDWATLANVRTVYAPGFDASVSGFDRRVLVAQASDIAEEQITAGVTLEQLMDQAGADLLANNNFTKLVDGELVPQANFRYGVDYALGDTIELAPNNVTVQKAMITEYIRSADNNGQREYPTVSVVS